MDNDGPGMGNYRLNVRNFGPIVEADVELRPLTVFLGPSNTGKSYLAILAYALHRCFWGKPSRYSKFTPAYRRGWSVNRHDYTDHGAQWKSIVQNPQNKESLKNWVHHLSRAESMIPMPPAVENCIRSNLEHAHGLDQFLKEEICRCFGINRLGELIRRSGTRKNSEIRMVMPNGDASSHIDYLIDIVKDEISATGKIPKSTPLMKASTPLDKNGVDELVKLCRENMEEAGDTESSLDESDTYFGASVYLWDFLGDLSDVIIKNLISPLYRNTFYLPADRTGVMHSHEVVVSALIQQASTAGLHPSPELPQLSGVLADFLTQLIGLQGTQWIGLQSLRRKPRDQIAHSIEQNILVGEISMDKSESNYPKFSYRPTGWKDDLSLMRTSSMVSELAPVVLYLRHLVTPGDVLIIEEPESHLHPAMQAAFARELTRAVRSGIRIIVTTHSEWLLEQFSNLVNLSELPEDQRTDIRGADATLSPDQFGAWLFKSKKNPKGSIVEEIKLDPEGGGLSADYENIAEELYNDFVKIERRLRKD